MTTFAKILLALAIALVGALVFAPAAGAEIENGVLRLSDEEKALCAAEACILVSKDRLSEFVSKTVAEAYEAGVRYERATCASRAAFREWSF